MIQCIYDGTTIRFEGGLAPDLPVTGGQNSGIDKRWSFYGTYRQNVRYNKWYLNFSLSGITSANSQTLRAMVEADLVGTWTGLSPTVTGLGGTLYGKIPTDSYRYSETGFDSFDIAFTVQEV